MFTMYSFFNKLFTVTGNNNTTRLHSSRMRTARALTVSPDMLCAGGGGGAGVWGGLSAWRVCSQGGVCSGGWSAPGGSAPGGVCSGGVAALGGCLLQGVSALGGVCSQGGGCLLPRGGGVGVCSWWGVVASKHALRQTPPAVNRITHACENIALPQLRCGR